MIKTLAMLLQQIEKKHNKINNNTKIRQNIFTYKFLILYRNTLLIRDYHLKAYFCKFPGFL